MDTRLQPVTSRDDKIGKKLPRFGTPAIVFPEDSPEKQPKGHTHFGPL